MAFVDARGAHAKDPRFGLYERAPGMELSPPSKTFTAYCEGSWSFHGVSTPRIAELCNAMKCLHCQTNMEPDTGSFIDYCPLERVHFQVPGALVWASVDRYRRRLLPTS